MFDKRNIKERLLSRFVHEENFLKVLDQIDRAFKSYQLVVTDFITPGMYSELYPYVSMERDFNVRAFGGHEDAERVRLAIYPDYIEVEPDDYDIVLMKSRFPAKFENLSHRDILGALMNQGIRREKLGDLFVIDDEIYIYIAKDIEDYISFNLERIRKVKVNFEKVSYESFIPPKREFKAVSGTVSSNRLDAVIAFACNIARGKASQMVKGELVKVNHRVITQGTYEVNDGDLLSVRGFGRIKVASFGGLTKKDRMKITLHKYI